MYTTKWLIFLGLYLLGASGFILYCYISYRQEYKRSIRPSSYEVADTIAASLLPPFVLLGLFAYPFFALLGIVYLGHKLIENMVERFYRMKGWE